MTAAECDAILARLRVDAAVWPVKHELDALRERVGALEMQVARLQAERVVFPFYAREARA